ncbi:ubiquitin carboxyl-terminal hydrolase 3-like [Epinephelus fuscoguttatus]|uniref:ubiquitin carboxyl-terminal hydrolase 3-like n=1 Tax=Epinephelus fuscoguttatus TaxID=293821 RepID=UPI0020D1CDDD|nr:ubiquitin carboxyl-terminal hydrolase 3-like [Epinephelus fuscoguttatus]
MFRLCGIRQQTNKTPAEEHMADTSKPCSSSHMSDAATSAPVSAKPAKTRKHKKTRRIMKRLFGQSQKTQRTQKDTEGRNESDPTLAVTSTEVKLKPKKTPWWTRLFVRVKAAEDDNDKGQKEPKTSSPETPDETTTEQDTTEQDVVSVQDIGETKEDETSEDRTTQEQETTEQDVVSVQDISEKETKEEDTSDNETTQEQEMRTLPQQEEVAPLVSGEKKLFSLSGGQSRLFDDDFLLPGLPDNAMMMGDNIDVLMERFYSNTASGVSVSGGVKGSNTSISCFGFPNIGQSCYMNSSLQSLLTLETLVRDISCQEPIWSSVPEAQLMRRFTAIKEVHTSTGPIIKVALLRSFKEDVSVQAPEFSDSEQKDAHEFLISVLNQMWSLSPTLQNTAVCMGRKYTCPVEDHLVFKMENTRTCKRCGAESKRQEVYTNLSLDLLPGGSVEDMLQEYLKETELEYRCECGGNTSGQRLAFETLPRVLIFHLKRFRFTSYYEVEKVNYPVELLRDLVVSCKQDGVCYSLVSVISHLGSTGESGHYISDGVHPDDRPDEPTDRWLNFNDSVVTETSGWSVCEERQKTAYILFYKRHE